MKIFPWEWGHWLIFSSSFVQCPRLSRVGGRGAGIYFDWCICLKYCQLNGHEKIDEERSEGRPMLRKVDALKLLDDDITGIFHVFEMQIGMNEFDHRILALLEYQRRRKA